MSSMFDTQLESGSDHSLELVSIKRTTLSDSITQDEEFRFSDSNVHVLVEKRVFHIHRYKLEDFRKIKPLVKDESFSGLIELPGNPNDFSHTFKLLYTPLHLADSLSLDAPTLISVLRIATNFDHPSLRSFATIKLEALALPAVECLRIGRELDIVRWKDMAIEQLVNRDEPLTSEEFHILGVDSAVSITGLRESKLRRRMLAGPSIEEYNKLPLAKRVKLREQYGKILNASKIPFRTESSEGPSSLPPGSQAPSLDPIEPLVEERPAKRAKISGDIKGIRKRVATLAHHMHESVTASVAPSVNSDQGWDSSYQVDSLSASVLASLQLHPGHPAPLSVASMGGTTKKRDTTSVSASNLSTPISSAGPPQQPGEEPQADSSYNFDDGNVTVQIDQSLFRVHEFKLREFEDLRNTLQDAQKDGEGRKTIYLTTSSDDFRRMLAVLYSSGYEQPTFTSGTLKAALRFATTFKHRTLREYAIQNLEKRTLQAIERFALSRDCGITSWMGPALDDLCWREEPISVDEAQILGFEKFAEVASRREAVKYERGSRLKLDMMDNVSQTSATPPPREPLPLPSSSVETTSVSSQSSGAPSVVPASNLAPSSLSSRTIETSGSSGGVELGVPFTFSVSEGLGTRVRKTSDARTGRSRRAGEYGGFKGFRPRSQVLPPPKALSQAGETPHSDSDA